MDFQDLIQRKRDRFAELEREIADPALFENRKRAQEIMREHSSVKQMLALWNELDTTRRQLADNRELAAAGRRRDGADGAGGNSRAGETARGIGARFPDRALAAGRKREPRCDHRNSRRHRRQRGRHFRGRSLPDVRPLRGDGGIENRRSGVESVRAGRIARSDLQSLGRKRFPETAFRKRRAPRATRSRHGSAGPHPHLHRHRRRAARKRKTSISISSRKISASKSAAPAVRADKA